MVFDLDHWIRRRDFSSSLDNTSLFLSELRISECRIISGLLGIPNHLAGSACLSKPLLSQAEFWGVNASRCLSSSGAEYVGCRRISTANGNGALRAGKARFSPSRAIEEGRAGAPRTDQASRGRCWLNPAAAISLENASANGDEAMTRKRISAQPGVSVPLAQG